MDTRQGSNLAVAAIKTAHSAVFLVELGAIGWLVYTGFRGRRDRTVVLAAGLVGIEVAVFLANKGVCPMTTMVERRGDAHGSVSDIFLPAPVARTIPIWSSALLGLAALLHIRAARRREPDRRPSRQGL